MNWNRKEIKIFRLQYTIFGLQNPTGLKTQQEITSLVPEHIFKIDIFNSKQGIKGHMPVPEMVP